ncbi:MAG: hypothetical protein ACPKPY_09745 [Nitrososphaeraceae archaeon]
MKQKQTEHKSIKMNFNDTFNDSDRYQYIIIICYNNDLLLSHLSSSSSAVPRNPTTPSD